MYIIIHRINITKYVHLTNSISFFSVAEIWRGVEIFEVLVGWRCLKNDAGVVVAIEVKKVVKILGWGVIGFGLVVVVAKLADLFGFVGILVLIKGGVFLVDLVSKGVCDTGVMVGAIGWTVWIRNGGSVVEVDAGEILFFK